MESLDKLLGSTPDGREFIVTFACGDVFSLKDFEMVDESIYDRADFCVADIVSQIKCDKKLYRVGSGIQFSTKDVVTVKDAISGGILFELPKSSSA